ncbi:hypothetical protein [Flavobacterium flavipallidum]|uniref:Uncharacterized protein n=1 Tax=Flavobacterium flavipallidum TaxID=3139140 RepID=A0ABU9HNK9_9FLAO
MKKLFMLCAFIITHSIFSQSTTKLKVTESAEYKDDIKSIDILTIHTTESGETAIIRNGKHDFLFDIFDKNLKKTFSKVVEAENDEKFVGELFYQNQLKFFTVYAPEKDKRIVYCHTLNLTTKSCSKTTIFETAAEKNQSIFGSERKHKTNFALSPNGDYFAIATDNILKNKNSYTIRVFDSKSEKLIYTKSYQEDEKKTFEFNDLFVDNNGNAFSLGKLYKNGLADKNASGDANYQFVLNKISKDQTSFILIDLENEHINSLSISNNNNELNLIGFYSELNVNRIKGGCTFVINTNDLSIKRKKIQELPKQVYDDLYGYRTAERKNDKKKELRNFDIDYVLRDDTNNVFLVAEEFYITTMYVSTGMYGGGYWQTIYHYDDILILKFNAEGDLVWGRSVYKRATAPSYNAFLKNDQLHIILNSGKNLTEKTDGRTKLSKGWLESTSLYDLEYSNNGEVSYNKIQDNNGNEFYLPFYGTYEGNKFIMMNDGRKKKIFMTLE